ncbi:hypothetical protein F1B92_03535 [Campylobacter sp. FMV-PI01]|uniref:PpiC domain-containing protein n=1 Tax=Campylobacter portucalensis TaxID=2608384 RepID=A0A6L5WK86_9BACT|nr:peptidylprolyl isomerase [Campylobacter portucalensis]MSN96273.1 hypothetical protein [Campylobacter portucalensis]
MINWMQKHKKALIPAIWISTIAFVGAGFVGWGAYDMRRDRSTSVAMVGDTAVTIQDFRQKYNSLYNYFNTISNGRMSQEEARQIKLDQIALSESIKDAIRLNFAKNLGLGASDKDVIKYLITMPEFKIDGKFNEQLYKDTLKNAGIKPLNFENDLKKNIVINKLAYAINLPATNLDLEALQSAFFMQDRLLIDIVSVNLDELNISEDELKEFWQTKKDSYQTTKSYDIDALFISSKDANVSNEELKAYWQKNENSYKNSDDTIKTYDEAKNEALNDLKLEKTKSVAVKKYLELKKGNLQTESKLTVSENNQTFPIQNIIDKKEGEFIKPFEYKDGYLIAKISNINEPQTMSFEEAKNLVNLEYQEVKAKNELEKIAQTALENFKGRDIGFVSRDSKMSFENLSEGEFSIFLNELFNTNNKIQGFITLNNKAVVYKIIDQKLENADKLKEYKELLSQNASNLKNSILGNDLLNTLEKQYKIEQFYKGDHFE